MAGVIYHDISTVWDADVEYGDQLAPQWGLDIHATLDDKLSMTNTSTQSIASDVEFGGDLLPDGTCNIGSPSSLFSSINAITFKGTTFYNGASGGGFIANGIWMLDDYMFFYLDDPLVDSNRRFMIAQTEGAAFLNYHLIAGTKTNPATNTWDLGSSSVSWRNLYVERIVSDRYMVYSGAEVLPIDEDATTYLLKSHANGTAQNTDTSFHEYIIPLRFPDGAKLKSFELVANDTTQSGRPQRKKIINSADASEPLLDTTIGDNINSTQYGVGGTRNIYSTFYSGRDIIDNSQYSYFFKITINPSDIIYGLIVRFE